MHDKIPHYNVWCAGISEVEIDVLTGEKRVLRYKVEERIINNFFKSTSDFLLPFAKANFKLLLS